MSLIHLLSVILLYPTYITAAGDFVAYGDFNCQDQKLDIWSDGVPVPDSTLRTDYSIKDWDSHAGGHYYENLTFSEAAKTNHTLDQQPIQVVWWKLQEADPTCQYIIMKDSPRGWQVLNKLPGDEIIRADREGCYYSALRPGDSLITSFCCGHDDCAIAEIEKKPAANPQNTATGEAPKCSLINSYSSTPTVEDGPQIGVTRAQGCEAPPACTHSVSESQSFSTAVSYFRSYTWTTQTGVEVGFTSGVDFLADAKSNVDITTSIAQSFMDETGTALTVGNITTSSEGSRQVPGTFAFYSFTPQYNCWKGDVSCGKDQDGEEKILKGINFCQPMMSTSGDAAGTFRMVYISDGR
ncbi:uncharacterized protein GGS22DRAFT_190967 [Annulohypoxylon maeteangense]|uniref:uncharacterized protein n=1 Tax=Annulohypoxylon maeteangense TaxID=1927788 RepID=UPI00200825F8|nr:uncharacterized protein GGS22DRAFT_190967 [Annulohypoxylon maeteangense]KAI0882992.1 hypothetical protein GGS22DRAFT_190967 [Annulohypoxylon maeteangense]